MLVPAPCLLSFNLPYLGSFLRQPLASQCLQALDDRWADLSHLCRHGGCSFSPFRLCLAVYQVSVLSPRSTLNSHRSTIKNASKP